MKKITPLLAVFIVLTASHTFGQNTKKIVFAYDKSGHLIEKKTPAFTLQELSKPLLPVDSTQLPLYQVSPVPGNTIIHIDQVNGPASRIRHMELYNLSGQLIRSIDSIESTNATIDVSELTGGLYLLVVTRITHEKEIHKIIIND
jgi:hypothetical protein